MFRTLIAATLSVTALAGAAQAATTLTFDTTPAGPVTNFSEVTTAYQSLGVSFELFEDGASVGGASLQNTFEVQSGMGYNLGNFVAGSAYAANNRADVLRMSFTSAVESVYFDHNGWGGATVFNAYDKDGVLLETVTADVDASTINLTSTGILSIEALQAHDCFAFGIDNLTFSQVSTGPTPGPAPVPLPAALPLLLAGLGGLRLVSRRR